VGHRTDATGRGGPALEFTITMRPTAAIILAAAFLTGCDEPMTCPRAIFLDGAGWYSGDGPVRDGLREGGFEGPVDRFGWQSLLGPLHDHIVADEGHPDTRKLAERITRLREADPNGQIVLIGYSAGTSILVGALEKLPENVEVDIVVLLAPSVSSRHDLTRALRHVRGRLYATSSPHDALLRGAAPAGLERGRPAGLVGIQLPQPFTPAAALYRQVISLPWRPEYAMYGWDGGHMTVTRADFIRTVIAPRIVGAGPHPLDRPLARMGGRNDG